MIAEISCRARIDPITLKGASTRVEDVDTGFVRFSDCDSDANSDFDPDHETPLSSPTSDVFSSTGHENGLQATPVMAAANAECMGAELEANAEGRLRLESLPTAGTTKVTPEKMMECMLEMKEMIAGLSER